jgi:hypothetical protein
LFKGGNHVVVVIFRRAVGEIIGARQTGCRQWSIVAVLVPVRLTCCLGDVENDKSSVTGAGPALTSS